MEASELIGRKACQSYIRGEQLCADGFPVTSLCTGDAACASCGCVGDAAIPLCLKEEAPPHLFTDRGAPRFARALQHQGEAERGS